MRTPSRALLPALFLAASRAGPAHVLAAALCVAFPFAWNACFPSHAGEPVLVTLTPLPETRLALPARRVEASVAEKAPDGTSARVTYTFPWSEPGRYTLYGISSFDDAQPLELSLNGAAVSSMAFFRDTGSRREDFERHRLATGVEVVHGVNSVALDGPWALFRGLALELRHEAPLGWVRGLLLALAAALALALRAAVVRRIALAPAPRLVATAVFTLLFAVGPILVASLVDGRALADLDQADRRKRALLDELERYLASEEHLRARDGGFSVCVLGDSTHFWPRPPGERMLPSLRAALPEDAAARIEIFGISAGAFSAYDYYLLANRLLRDDPPDLLVVPVNLRSFSPWWLGLRDHDFPRNERHLGAGELLRAHGLEVGDRVLRWDQLLLVHADRWLFDGDAAALLRGAARYLHAERDRLLANARVRAQPGPDPFASAPADWPERVTPDHPMLEPFRLLNGLAARRGVPILYYTVQANAQAQARRGVRLDLRSAYAVIEAEIGRAPGVTWLDLSASNPAWMFADEQQHLSRRGMEHVAGRLARAIVSLSRAPRRLP